MNDAVLINQPYTGSGNRTALYDYYPAVRTPHDAVLFIHGYMGFKDWGCWHLVATYFQECGLSFVKANLTHNGTTTESPLDFSDPEAFAQNSYSKELSDILAMIDVLVQQHGIRRVHLIGHSRAGGMVLLAGAHPCVATISCWAPISSIEKRFPNGAAHDQWKKEGYYYRVNGRTGQAMPHAFSQWEDFVQYKQHLDIEAACRGLPKPITVLHGSADTSVSPEEGKLIARWSGVKLHLIDGANHTFGSTHPWNKKLLPSHLLKVCQLTFNFITSIPKE